ncbi:MAG: FecR family protein, partial [Caldimicrobium sp.]|nr:FecR family protein [Caldimicrobium sp.]
MNIVYFRKNILGLIFLLVFLILNATLLQAKTVGKVTGIEGVAEVLRAGKIPAIPLKLNDLIYEKDILRTKSGAKLEITFTDGSVLRVAQRSRVDISEYLLEEANRAVLELKRGTVQAQVNPELSKKIEQDPKKHKFEIKTPVAVAGVRGTDFFVFHERVSTGVLVKTGQVYTYNPQISDKVVIAQAGQITFISEGKPPTPPRAATEKEMKQFEKETYIEKRVETTPPERPEDQKVMAQAQPQAQSGQPPQGDQPTQPTGSPQQPTPTPPVTLAQPTTTEQTTQISPTTAPTPNLQPTTSSLLTTELPKFTLEGLIKPEELIQTQAFQPTQTILINPPELTTLTPPPITEINPEIILPSQPPASEPPLLSNQISTLFTSSLVSPATFTTPSGNLTGHLLLNLSDATSGALWNFAISPIVLNATVTSNSSLIIPTIIIGNGTPVANGTFIGLLSGYHRRIENTSYLKPYAMGIYLSPSGTVGGLEMLFSESLPTEHGNFLAHGKLYLERDELNYMGLSPETFRNSFHFGNYSSPSSTINLYGWERGIVPDTSFNMYISNNTFYYLYNNTSKRTVGIVAT